MGRTGRTLGARRYRGPKQRNAANSGWAGTKFVLSGTRPANVRNDRVVPDVDAVRYGIPRLARAGLESFRKAATLGRWNCEFVEIPYSPSDSTLSGLLLACGPVTLELHTTREAIHIHDSRDGNGGWRARSRADENRCARRPLTSLRLGPFRP